MASKGSMRLIVAYFIVYITFLYEHYSFKMSTGTNQKHSISGVVYLSNEKKWRYKTFSHFYHFIFAWGEYRVSPFHSFIVALLKWYFDSPTAQIKLYKELGPFVQFNLIRKSDAFESTVCECAYLSLLLWDISDKNARHAIIRLFLIRLEIKFICVHCTLHTHTHRI